MIDHDNIYVHLIDFKTTKVKETVTQNADGTYTIFLNSRYNDEQLRKSYLHAVKHIDNNDFEKFDVDTIELVCHKCA